MKELELLEMELILLQDNIKRLKEFKKEQDKVSWVLNNSAVVGEFKHRLVSLKSRLTLVSKITTHEYLKSK